jgi:ADP-ribosylglycohydrolase
VPFALWAVATRREYEPAVRTCVEAGGDMDTTAAIAGGIIAAHQGTGCVPAAWLSVREPLPAWLQVR